MAQISQINGQILMENSKQNGQLISKNVQVLSKIGQILSKNGQILSKNGQIGQKLGKFQAKVGSQNSCKKQQSHFRKLVSLRDALRAFGSPSVAPLSFCI